MLTSTINPPIPIPTSAPVAKPPFGGGCARGGEAVEFVVVEGVIGEIHRGGGDISGGGGDSSRVGGVISGGGGGLFSVGVDISGGGGDSFSVGGPFSVGSGGRRRFLRCLRQQHRRWRRHCG